MPIMLARIGDTIRRIENGTNYEVFTNEKQNVRALFSIPSTHGVDILLNEIYCSS